MKEKKNWCFKAEWAVTRLNFISQCDSPFPALFDLIEFLNDLLISFVEQEIFIMFEIAFAAVLGDETGGGFVDGQVGNEDQELLSVRKGFFAEFEDVVQSGGGFFCGALVSGDAGAEIFLQP